MRAIFSVLTHEKARNEKSINITLISDFRFLVFDA